MYKYLRKISVATIASFVLVGTVYSTVESGKANAESAKAVDKEMKQREKIGNALLEEIDNSKKDFKDPSVTEKLKGQVRDYKNGVAERGKATITAKAGAKAIRATVNKVGEKAWDKLVAKIENTTGTKLVMFHYQSINKFCDILTGFEGNLAEGMATGLTNNFGFNKQFAYIVARAFIAIVL
ncbi:hypothetical protein LZA84_08475 [Staphylococcus aureus]|uniref:hypothetical protein n=1 Tax=Staphylococcus aureus TaxID=1280 RepID=UPI00112F3945|nr:hypothetical protein [Staphylococcus aureus]MCL4587274.1 hypothetical protein [Staphylococcus aureus]MCL4618596.1 hypothetical protein [Staphylococcus aureus]HDJ2048989.1 hypothetical protein [Staphylococcus aureus]HDM8589277.1 hypothetical protein [Staphylococcus aureus]HDM8623943.1 hypothetical protein [Staphylococcus aureus]